MTSSMTVGYALTAIAILFNGSLLVPYRSIYPNIPLEPIIFQLYTTIGFFLTCWMAMAFLPLNDVFVSDGSTRFSFSLLGMIGGVLLTIYIYLNFFSAAKIGMSITQGITSGASVIASYFWGVVILEERPKMLFISILGAITITMGLLVTALCKEIANYRNKPQKKTLLHEHDEEAKEIDGQSHLSEEAEQILFEHNPSRNRPQLEESLIESIHKSDQEIERRDFMLGVLLAFFSGLSSGLMLAPLSYAPDKEQGLVFLPAFGVSSLAMSFVLMTINTLNPFEYYPLVPNLYFYETFGIGLFSGFIRCAALILTIASIDRLHYALAIPLIQSSLLIAGLWGIGLFGELKTTDGAALIFTIGAGLIVSGAVLLGVAQ
eukprot:gene8340-9193_t